MKPRKITVDIPNGTPDFHIGHPNLELHGLLVIRGSDGGLLAAYWPGTWLRMSTQPEDQPVESEAPDSEEA